MCAFPNKTQKKVHLSSTLKSISTPIIFSQKGKTSTSRMRSVNIAGQQHGKIYASQKKVRDELK